MKVQLFSLFAAAFVPLAAHAQDHGHLDIGANEGQVRFDNGALFGPETGYVKTFVLATEGKYAGFYQGNITLTALHARDAFGELIPGAPAPGSFIVAEIVSVAGPEGGAFMFWEAGATAETAVSIPAGTTNAAVRWDVSDAALGAGAPDGDPYGHIHGRRFTVTKPGLYTVGFRAHDTSTNGPSGGPLQTTSDLLLVQFQGGITITGIEPEAEGTTVTFGAAAAHSWQLQSRDELGGGEWVNAGAAVAGNDTLKSVLDETPAQARRFYRLAGTPVEQ